MKTLYPEIDSVSVYHLAVDPPHELYVEECGNKDGIPVVLLHGGPGSGCKPYHRQFFDPAHYRIIIFDQRGAGRSTPRGELSQNNTQALIDDIETIREHLGIEAYYEPVADNEYLSDFYRDTKKYSFAMQVYLLNRRFQQHSVLAPMRSGEIIFTAARGNGSSASRAG